MSKKPLLPKSVTALEKEILGDHLRKKYMDDIGQKAIVERHVSENDYTEQLREVLQDIGRDLVKTGSVPDGVPYVGSCAVHIYVAPTTKTMYFSVQDALGSTPMLVANTAIQELSNTIGESYTGKRRKKRSGL